MISLPAAGRHARGGVPVITMSPSPAVLGAPSVVCADAVQSALRASSGRTALAVDTVCPRGEAEFRGFLCRCFGLPVF